MRMINATPSTIPSPITDIVFLQENLESRVHAGLGSRSLGDVNLLKKDNLIFYVFLQGHKKEETLIPDTAVTTKQQPIRLKELEGFPHLKRELRLGSFP